jgi:nucleoside-diphosphate-sugar epimerase
LVLVVGGTGRVGRRIVARLAAAGVRVRVHPTLYARIRNPKPRPKL